MLGKPQCLRPLLVALVTVASFAALAPVAGATTICVPTFSAACPDSGDNVAEADLEKAMGIDGSDGEPDQIIIAAGTLTENGAYEPAFGFKSPASIEPEGDDSLTVTGAGDEATFVTADSGANVYLLGFGAGSAREITVRDLTVQVPAVYPDNLGAGVNLRGDVLEGVRVESLNPGSDGVVASGVGNVVRGGTFGGGGISGTLDTALSANSDGARLLVEDAILEGVSWGLSVSGEAAEVTARRVQGRANVYGAHAGGGTVRIENSALRIDDGIGLYASAASDDSTVIADHVTLLNSGNGFPAIEGKRFDPGPGEVAINVSNSILRGFSSGYRIENMAGPGIGAIAVTARYSNLPLNGTDTNGVVDFTAGNIDQDPLLNADLSLPPGSPSVDAGDPAPGGLLTDFLGAPRPNDGNGDGTAVRDQGAFEHQRPAPPGGGDGGGGSGPSQPADDVAPQTTIAKGPGTKLAQGKARFSFRSSEKNSTFKCRLDGRKVSGCKSPKSYNGLKPGPHVFKVWAIDAAGNKDRSPAKRRFRVSG